MFTDVPPSYDFVNRVLTWRFDVIWRKKAASESLKNSPSKILDLCTGTGDLALQIRKKTESGAKVFALDYSKAMLKLAITKANKKKYDDITFIHADVANIPFPDSHFDVCLNQI
jgi:demethylmenaquinone methyltransferase/2-methoxy-6-polyprenyl-1,4-benzoquinol methylase